MAGWLGIAAFPVVSALYGLKSSSPSASVFIVVFSIVSNDWMNDNERDSSENLEVW